MTFKDKTQSAFLNTHKCVTHILHVHCTNLIHSHKYTYNAHTHTHTHTHTHIHITHTYTLHTHTCTVHDVHNTQSCKHIHTDTHTHTTHLPDGILGFVLDDGTGGGL